MIDLGAPSIYERVINEKDNQQIRLVINTFRGVEYLSLRKYYLDFDEEWLPSKEGITMPVDFLTDIIVEFNFAHLSNFDTVEAVRLTIWLGSILILFGDS